MVKIGTECNKKRFVGIFAGFLWIRYIYPFITRFCILFWTLNGFTFGAIRFLIHSPTQFEDDYWSCELYGFHSYTPDYVSIYKWIIIV